MYFLMIFQASWIDKASVADFAASVGIFSGGVTPTMANQQTLIFEKAVADGTLIYLAFTHFADMLTV